MVIFYSHFWPTNYKIRKFPEFISRMRKIGIFTQLIFAIEKIGNFAEFIFAIYCLLRTFAELNFAIWGQIRKN